MKRIAKHIAAYLPLLLGLVILVIAASLVPWPEVLPYLLRLSPTTLVTLVALSLMYYTGRSVRYWLMLRVLGHPMAFTKVALACLVAQPVAFLPGGEMYRGTMLKRYGNVALRHGLPSVFAQSVAETIGLLILALLGISLLHQYISILLIITGLIACIWAFILWHDESVSRRLLARLPWIKRHQSSLRSFLQKNRQLLTGRSFVELLLASYITTVAGIIMVYVTAHSLGVTLGIRQAALAYVLPTVLETVSFLPGGLGVQEQGSVGILTLFGVPLAPAVAITILVRLFTLGIGFVYGFAAMAWDKLGGYKRYGNI
jgi:uncharacterized protein (TIRG00374 family)